MRHDDVAWKKLQGDVFRKPDFAVLLCSMSGMGIQCVLSMYCILLFMTISFLNPYSRFYNFWNIFAYMVIGGFVNGYFTARSMKYFGASEWRFAASVAAVALPLYIVGTFCLVDIIEYFEKSDQIFPFTAIVLFFFLWLIFNVPASYYGAYVAFKNSDDKAPLKINSVRREVPPQPWYLHSSFSTLVVGFLMFSVVMSEFHYVLTSVWRSYMIGMFFLYFVNFNLLLAVVTLLSCL